MVIVHLSNNIVYEDGKLREELLRRDKDLDEVLSMCRRSETTRNHLKKFKALVSQPTSSATDVDRVTTKRYPPPKTERQVAVHSGSIHGPRSCAAYGKTCTYCGKLGHFGKASTGKQRTQYVKQIEDLVSPDGTSFDTISIGISIGSLSDSKWKAILHAADQSTEFKLDTGTMASVLPLSTYRRIYPHATHTGWDLDHSHRLQQQQRQTWGHRYNRYHPQEQNYSSEILHHFPGEYTDPRTRPALGIYISTAHKWSQPIPRRQDPTPTRESRLIQPAWNILRALPYPSEPWSQTYRLATAKYST